MPFMIFIIDYKPTLSRAWLLRFAKSTSEYFAATFLEAQIRFYKHWPNTESYTLKRPFSGGFYTDIDLIEVAEKIYISCFIHTHPRLTKLANLINNVDCWTHDILSLHKELAHGDMHKMVLIMHHELKISLQESPNLVKKRIDAQIQQFQTVDKQLS